ncbi:MAG: hypothetical protein GX774_02160 [Armatimonadetes bacterium]|jgi:methyl-accepting chemotaxis protein|nr:hypothetical protein [Armatimonadota bacterium]
MLGFLFSKRKSLRARVLTEFGLVLALMAIQGGFSLYAITKLCAILISTQAAAQASYAWVQLVTGVAFAGAVVVCYRAVQNVVRGLAEASSDLSNEMAELTTRAQEFSAVAAEQATGATEQAAAVSEITATMEELSRTAQQIAHAAGEALTAAEDGQGAVRQTVAGMEQIKARVDDVATRILSLGEKSQRIGEINEIITDIAGKTHLLALNAAIESAAAGEFGARFAVVAAQVKELADETREATSQVKSVILEIQNAINASVMATGETTNEVARGAELAQRSGSVITEIVDRVQGISVATQQQRSASEQVVTTMRDIQEVVRTSASGSQQVAEGAAGLAAVSQRLGGVVARLSHDSAATKPLAGEPG